MSLWCERKEHFVMLSALRRTVGVLINLTLVTGAIAMPVSRCKLLYPDSGSVTLRIKNRGNCVVFETGREVPGQWKPFKTFRTHVGR